MQTLPYYLIQFAFRK